MTLREQPGLIRYLAAAVLGRVADEGGRIVLVLLAIDRTGSTAVGGLLAGCFLVPHVIAAPISGAIADRSPHRARVQGAALVTFGFCLALVAILAGNVPNGVLMVVAIIGGCAGPLLTGGMTSLLGNLVPGATRDRAYGLDIATYNLAGIVGPAAGAMLAALVSPMIATFALGASALAGGILVVRLPGEKPSGQYGRPAVETSLLSLDAMRHMVRNPSLRTATIVSSLGASHRCRPDWAGSKSVRSDKWLHCDIRPRIAGGVRLVCAPALRHGPPDPYCHHLSWVDCRTVPGDTAGSPLERHCSALRCGGYSHQSPWQFRVSGTGSRERAIDTDPDLYPGCRNQDDLQRDWYLDCRIRCIRRKHQLVRRHRRGAVGFSGNRDVHDSSTKTHHTQCGQSQVVTSDHRTGFPEKIRAGLTEWFLLRVERGRRCHSW
jgi:hypothetical protein